MASEIDQPTLVAVVKPLSLIPVGLKEAALDSPSFRATTVHFSDQIEALERWLEGYVKSAGKLASEVSNLEGAVNTFLLNSEAPNHLSEAILDHDYTMLAMQRGAEGSRDFWSHVLGGLKRSQRSIVDPIKIFLNSEVRPFKEARRQLESTQRTLDSVMARYLGQPKTKEPSSLREDAFQLHEARKAYLKASMSFCVIVPQLKASLDTLLINVFSGQWLEMRSFRESTTNVFAKHGSEVDRIRSWSTDLSLGGRLLKKELQTARHEIEDSAELATRPSRELDDYSASTVPYIGSRAQTTPQNPADENAVAGKQGWLFLRTVTGKPSRTTWVRRWFFVKNGIFGWLIQGTKSGGVEESEKIGVLLCNVRPAFQEERRFCFEIKTKDTNLLLQAETQHELMEWIKVFETAKQKALDKGLPTDTGDGQTVLDAAFAVNPAIAPELAAKRADGYIANIADEAAYGLQVPENDGSSDLAFRNSPDVSTTSRRNGEPERERSRDHAARIIQKLDLHRKTNASPQLSAIGGHLNSPPPLSGGGIASLISASHSALPLRPPGATGAIQTVGLAETNSLAPTTLATPPQATNLSKTAVLIGMERGLDLGAVDATGGIPSSLMANQWGSANYGHISRVDRGEVRGGIERSASPVPSHPTRRLSDPPVSKDDISLSEHTSNFNRAPSPANDKSANSLAHRRIFSETDGQLQNRKRQLSDTPEVPSFYPQNLRAQDAQLRMLFPNVDPKDRVVLVFRASWSTNEQKDLPGRVYVTMKDMYYYSHQYGLTLVSGTHLSTISEVSAIPGSDHDYILLRIASRRETDEPRTIALKTFIEPIKILKRRLSYLVSNAQCEEPAELEEVLNTLIAYDRDLRDLSPHSDAGPDVSPPRSFIDPQQFKHSLKVDKSLYNANVQDSVEQSDVTRFRLPAQPVAYAPRDMTDKAAEKVFGTSAKALFHICFGDKSLLSQMLYRDRRAKAIKQYPWSQPSGGVRSRKFEYTVSSRTASGTVQSYNIVDSQTIDICNDHLCYVVTDRKIPWHLPYSQSFCLVMKIVITHVAKSKAKLAIYIKTERLKGMFPFQGLVDRQALEDLKLDASDLIDLASDQVDKLGYQCDTKRAVEVFGHLGQQTEIAQINTDQSIFGRQGRTSIQHRTLIGLVMRVAFVTSSSIATALLRLFVDALQSLLNMLTTQRLFAVVLFLSLSLHLFGTSELASEWWHQRQTAEFMHRVGVHPDIVMRRTISLSDLGAAISSTDTNSPLLFSSNSSASDHSQSDNKCLLTFQSLLEDEGGDFAREAATADAFLPSARSTALRLQRTRERMGAYRHDLLVAMRLVNRIERETLQAEYESWIFDETTKCRRMETMLNQGQHQLQNSTQAASPSATPDSEQGEKQEQRIKYLSGAQESIREYCDSCRREHNLLSQASVL